MQKILVFSDLHIREAGKTARGIDPLERFSMALGYALDRHGDADRIVLTGDLVHTGRVSEYARLKPLLDACPVPVSLMTGNHDNRESLLSVFPDTPVASGFLQSAFDAGDTRVILLDTLDGPPFRRYHHAGLLCETRMAWLKSALEGAAGKRALLFMHHPAFRVGMDGMDEIRLANDRAFLDLVKQFPNVAHIFTGHLHRPVSGTIEGIGFTTFKSTGNQMPLVLNGLTPSMTTPEAGAYGLVLLYPDAVIAHSEDFGLSGENAPARGKDSLE